MNTKSFTAFCTGLLVAIGLFAGPALSQAAPERNVILVQQQGTTVTFIGGTAKAAGVLTVRVNGPNGRTVFERSSKTGMLNWRLETGMPNGIYNYDAWFTPAAAPTNRDLSQRKNLPKRDAKALRTRYEPGVFTIQGGLIVPQPLNDPGRNRKLSGHETPGTFGRLAGEVLNWLISPATAQDVEAEAAAPDFILDDTDNNVPVPVSEWWMGYRLDTDTFYMGDAEGKAVVTVEAGAPDKSLYIQSNGTIGLGTSTPSAKLHIIHGNAGGLVLQNQTAAAGKVILGTGLGPGDDPVGEGFYIHNVDITGTGGEGARALNINENVKFAFMVDANGDTGMGTANPIAPLHVMRSAGAQIRVEDFVAASGNRVMLYLKGAGTGKVRFLIGASDGTWSFNTTGDEFTIGRLGDTETEFLVDGSGNLVITGTLTEGSSRAIKDHIVPVDPATVLAKVETLPITEWSYETALRTRHIGPMAEDFYATFGLGPDSKHIAPKDLAGVSLAAIKALEAENDAKDARIAALEARLDRLEAVVMQ